MKTLITRCRPGMALGLCLAFGLSLSAAGESASTSSFDADLLAIQTNWARANYQFNGDAKEAAFDKLAEQASCSARPPA